MLTISASADQGKLVQLGGHPTSSDELMAASQMSPSDQPGPGAAKLPTLHSSSSGGFLPYQERLLSRTSSSTTKTSLNILASGVSSRANKNDASAPHASGHTPGQRSIDVARAKWEDRAGEDKMSPTKPGAGRPGVPTTPTSLASRRAMWDSMVSPGAGRDRETSAPAPRTPIQSVRPPVSMGPPASTVPLASSDPFSAPKGGQSIPATASASSTTAAPPSPVVVSRSTSTSTDASGPRPMLPEHTGSSNATSSSSVVGPDGKRFRSSYMARKEAMKRASALSLASDKEGSSIAEGSEDLATLTKAMLRDIPEPAAIKIRDDLPSEVQIDDAMRRLIANVGIGAEIHIGSERTPANPDMTLAESTKEVRAGLERMRLENQASTSDDVAKAPRRLADSPFLPSALAESASKRTPRYRPLSQDTFAPPNSTPGPAKDAAGPAAPAASKSAFRSVVAPPAVSPLSRAALSSRLRENNFEPLGALAPPSVGRAASKYGSIGKTDGRRLGRHLPRIASGDHQEEARADFKSREREPVAVKRSPAPLATSEVSSKQDSFTHEPQPVEPPATPTRSSRWPPVAATPAITPGKVAPDGKGMAGLVGKHATPTPIDRPGLQRAGSVTGVRGRVRLSRLPQSSTSAAVAPAPLPSRRLNTNWMDRQRKEIMAYEYLCHVGEAQQWIEGCLGEELSIGVVEMEEAMRDGVVLAKLARMYEGEGVVRQIWEVG